mmetsp:Transcript_137106/g.292838  ORF Transcript_137106/g.292838 Transcript_137106/m.292838 type:complete len:183 (-) Transcript_137106:146-694(-)
MGCGGSLAAAPGATKSAAAVPSSAPPPEAAAEDARAAPCSDALAATVGAADDGDRSEGSLTGKVQEAGRSPSTAASTPPAARSASAEGVTADNVEGVGQDVEDFGDLVEMFDDHGEPSEKVMENELRGMLSSMEVELLKGFDEKCVDKTRHEAVGKLDSDDEHLMAEILSDLDVSEMTSAAR